MKLNFKPLSWIILGLGFIVYLMLAMNDSHTPSQAVDNFVKSSFILMITLFVWTCVQIITGSFNIKQFSWVLSITGYIFSITVFCYFGVDQKTHWFRFNGILSASACAIAMFSTLPLLILYYKDNVLLKNEQKSDVNPEDKPAVESSEVEDDTWEPASIEDLYSGDYELEN
mgnify:CR=1 FL=1